MLVLREICREGYLSGKRKYFFLELEKRFTMGSICETKDGSMSSFWITLFFFNPATS